jgi:sterol desaturase/sphingolipid hydroxylase (fatty acid hydroxylase superfamily)
MMDFLKQLEVWIAVSAICFTIEMFFADRTRPKGQRKSIKTDVLYWLFNLFGSFYVTVGLGVLVVLALAALLPGNWIDLHNLAAPRDTLVSHQPLWLQAIEMLILGDFVAYWVHRACHRGVLWRFHTIHHSSPHINWMSVYRVHPLNDFLIRFPPVLVFILMGFDIKGALIYGPALTFYGAMEHMNVDWTFGPLKKIFTSPVFHRWHHTTEREGLNKNFAPMLPIYDILFRTYYMPENKRPETYGIKGETLPESFLRQMIYPFQKRRRNPDRPPQY